MEHLSILICPACGAGLEASDGHLKCSSHHEFSFDSRIPLLFWPNNWAQSGDESTETVKAFYEANPFPNYDAFDSPASLGDKAREGVFAQALDDEIPVDARILEVGCGTGQLSNFLGLVSRRAVFAADICLNSLRLGEAFRARWRLANVTFLQMNLFRPVFKPFSFDLVICNGVLHHTSDPGEGFQSIARLVRPGGYILVGLYNKYGRLYLDLRRLVFGLSGGRFRWLDPRLRNTSLSELRKQTWYLDQYQHPLESSHTIGEVLSWFKRAGFAYVNGIPRSTPTATALSEGDRLFQRNPEGTAFDHFIVQLKMALRSDKEGGFFIMLGRKQASVVR